MVKIRSIFQLILAVYFMTFYISKTYSLPVFLGDRLYNGSSYAIGRVGVASNRQEEAIANCNCLLLNFAK